MNSNIITLQKVDGIYDIQPIIAPAFSAFELTVLFILLISFLTANIYLVWIFVFSTKAKSKRKLVKLQKSYLHNNISRHDAIYELCKIIRKGLKQKQLDKKMPLPNNIKGNKQRWDKFINQLSDFRYKDSSDTSIDILPLFRESLFWLKL